MLGRWKNYDELEDSLSVEELLATVKSIRERDERDKKFAAAVQGINLDEASKPKEDITTLQDHKAGFGIGMGIGYEAAG